MTELISVTFLQNKEVIDMDESKILEIFERTGAFLAGHFELQSFRHSGKYINKDAVFPDTEEISTLGLEIAKRFVDDKIDVVVGPEKGGIILSQWVAHHLTSLVGRKVLSVFAEKIVTYRGTSGEFKFTRNYNKLVEGKRVLIVEDILTTGSSVKAVVKLVRLTGGIVVGLGALCNRGKVTEKDIGDVPKLSALLNVELETYPPRECPLCAQGIPMNHNVGRGKESLLQNEGK